VNNQERHDLFAAAALTGLLATGRWEPARGGVKLLWRMVDDVLAARGDKPTAPAADALRDAALALYEAGRWVSPDVSAVQADAMWATLRDALGLPAGYATDRGVADAAAGEPDGVKGTGDTRAAQEPVAWGVYCGHMLLNACLTQAAAVEVVKRWPHTGYTVAPLYAAPPAAGLTLTAAERRELEAAAREYESGAEKILYGRHGYRQRAATLRGLLARAAKEEAR